MIAGIILAAGASSRMGHPKALLEYRGETFAARLIRMLSAVCDPLIIVLGYHADVIRPRVEGTATIVINPAPERGQLSSLQTALASLPLAAEGFVFTTVDSPTVEAATIERLAAEFRKRKPATQLVIPSFQGKHGHPVFATRIIAGQLTALPPTSQAREVIHAHRNQTCYVDVDDPGVLMDIDRPEDFRNLVEAAR